MVAVLNSEACVGAPLGVHELRVHSSCEERLICTSQGTMEGDLTHYKLLSENRHGENNSQEEVTYPRACEASACLLKQSTNVSIAMTDVR